MELKSRHRGFTLIELVVVVAIVAILAAIAVPSFLDQVRKTRRSEAVAELQRLQLAMEQWRSNRPSYANASPAVATYPAGTTGNAHYSFAISGQTATGYTLTATAKVGSSQVNDREGGTSCTPMSITLALGVVSRSPAACFKS